MFQTKYEIKRPFKNDPNSDVVRIGSYDIKTVSKKEWSKLKDEGWSLIREKYFPFTNIGDFWRDLTKDQKITISLFIITSILGIAYFFVPLILEEPSSKTDSNESHAESTVHLETVDTIRIGETNIQGINLPLARKDLINELRLAFKNYIVTKEIGQQDGPDFPLYSIKIDKNEVLFFAMDSEDTLKLNEIFIKSPTVIDQYGLKIGDSYQEIKEKRKGTIKSYTDYHQHTYVYLDSSNILYEIFGNITLPDTVDFDNLHFTEDQIKDWTIQHLIWRE